MMELRDVFSIRCDKNDDDTMTCTFWKGKRLGQDTDKSTFTIYELDLEGLWKRNKKGGDDTSNKNMPQHIHIDMDRNIKTKFVNPSANIELHFDKGNEPTCWISRAADGRLWASCGERNAAVGMWDIGDITKPKIEGQPPFGNAKSQFAFGRNPKYMDMD